MTTSELDGMAVDLARFEGSARQDLEVHVNFMWIPAQAVEQVIQFRMTPIFITGLHISDIWPDSEVVIMIYPIASYFKIYSFLMHAMG